MTEKGSELRICSQDGVLYPTQAPWQTLTETHLGTVNYLFFLKIDGNLNEAKDSVRVKNPFSSPEIRDFSWGLLVILATFHFPPTWHLKKKTKYTSIDLKVAFGKKIHSNNNPQIAIL